MKRVVITGTGAVSPLGIGSAATWDGLVNGAPVPDGTYTVKVTKVRPFLDDWLSEGLGDDVGD